MKQQSRKTVGIIIGCLVVIGIILCVILAGMAPPTTKEAQTEMPTNKSALKTSESGLRYQVIKAAPAGASKPKSGQKVSVQYTGWLNNNDQPGQKFDSSLDRNEPFTFIVGKGQVIKGWDESVLDMHFGEKRRVIIPAELAYGSRAVGNIIPANSILIFDIDLLEMPAK